MLIAAIGSFVSGRLTWIVVDCEPFSTIGVCQTAIEPVLAASAAFAKTSVASAAAATSKLRKALMRRPFGVSLGGLHGLAEYVPEAVQVAHEVRLPDREVVRRRCREPQAGQQEWVGLVQVPGGVQEARAREIAASVLQRVDHRVG